MSDSPPPPPTSARPESLDGLIRRATAADGSPPFSDGSLIELANGERELVRLGDAVALVNAASAEFVVEPDARGQGQGARMLELLTADHAGPNRHRLFWAHGDHPAARALAASHGLRPVRELLHLEAAVRISTSSISGAGPISISGFAEKDAAAWLALNARAFADHPEQGAVTAADLAALMAEPWFDAGDFLLLWDGSALIGYCWLKVEGGEGEFYVVGVAPERQGEGWGRRLVQEGLARLASRGIRTAHLYVEGDNAAALRLYRSFGFGQRSIDVQYRWAPEG